MAKHLLPFKLLKGLLLAICLSIIAALPAAAALPSAPEDSKPSPDNIKVTKDPVNIAMGNWISLKKLIQDGVIEGIDISESQNFIPSCENQWVTCTANFRIGTPGTYVITYTHSAFPEIKFDLPVECLSSPTQVFYMNTIVEGQKKRLRVGSQCCPLKEYESIELVSVNGEDPNNILNLEVDKDNNLYFIEGLKCGDVRIKFKHIYSENCDSVNFHIGENTSEIKVKADKYFFPYVNQIIRIDYLILAGEIEGLSLDDCKKYVPSCTDSSLIIVGGSSCSVRPLEYKDYTVTYTNSEDPEVNFSVNYSVRKCFDSLIAYNARPVYVGETKTVYLTDEYLPLSNYTSFEIIEPYALGLDPSSIAVELPISVERANLQKPHAEME